MYAADFVVYSMGPTMSLDQSVDVIIDGYLGGKGDMLVAVDKVGAGNLGQGDAWLVVVDLKTMAVLGFGAGDSGGMTPKKAIELCKKAD